MKLPLWTLIPAIFILTLFYLGLGNFGHWNYTITDLINGNILVSSLIGLIYVSEYSYKRFKKCQHEIG